MSKTPNIAAKSDEAVPAEFKVPNEAPHPMFVQVDFGLVRDPAGDCIPKLVELQAFPSLYAYQGPLAQAYIDVYGLNPASGFGLPDSGQLKYLLSGLESDSYRELLRRAIVGSHDPENVILMEIDPLHQKTLPDFLADGENAAACAQSILLRSEKRALAFITSTQANEFRSSESTTAPSSMNWNART